MDLFETFVVNNVNFVFAIFGLLFALIFLKRISKQSAVLFYVIIVLCIILSFSTQFEEYLGNMGNTEQYKSYGGDIMRMTLSILNYILRPAVLLLFIKITTKTKIMPVFWGLVGLTVPIYTTAYYSGITFYISGNSFQGGSVWILRFYSPLLCFVLIGIYLLFAILDFIKHRSSRLIFNIITGAFAVIVAFLEMRFGGNILTLTIMIALILHFIVVYDDMVDEQQKELIRINNTDVLTNLGNERAYYAYLEEIDARKKKERKKYAIALMDLNGLKVTDDTLGHRFGCHLIVEFGHQLSEFFKTSKLFHIGGDEFVAILEGEDFKNRNKLLEKFIEEFSCKEIEFEDKKLILSVAIGMQESEKDQKYNDVFQLADKNMYANKKIVKKKYDIKSRIEEE